MRNWASYKSQIVTTLIGAAIGIASWGLLGTYNTASVPEYNTNYVSFLVSGIIITSMVIPISTGISSRLAPASLETILMTGINSPTYVLGSLGWTYIMSMVLVIPQLALALVLFPIALRIDPLTLVVAFAISSVIMFSLSMIAAGMRLVTKVTDPVSWFLAAAPTLLAGMTFPIQHLNSVLPGLSDVSWFIPQTWVYDTMRIGLLTGGSVADPSFALHFLGAAVVALVLLPLGIHAFNWGLRRAKQQGTIGWY
jgi:hypothetical protein